MLNLRYQITFSGLVALAIVWSPAAADTPRLLSAYDHQTYRAAFIASDNGRRGLAMSLAVKGHDPLPAKILRWLDMTRQGTHASFAELSLFIEANPNWPLRGNKHAPKSARPGKLRSKPSEPFSTLKGPVESTRALMSLSAFERRCAT